MVKLERINLKFDKVLLEDGKIVIPKGKVTTIVGDSGIGKSSLLYLIGLFSSNLEYEYIFEENLINLKNDSEISYYKRSKIGYIFQDNSLIDSLTVYENIKLAIRLASLEIIEEEIHKLLEYVHLDENILRKYPKQLSGGEKQRIAIAVTLAKKPDLIIADEPTSSLDEKNEDMILEIFQKIAKEDKMVVIATHNSKIKDASDVCYEISSRKINLIKGSIDEEIKTTNTNNYKKLKSISNKYLLQYTKSRNRKSKFQKKFVLFLCSVVIALSATISVVGSSFVDEAGVALNDISEREVFVLNKTFPSNDNMNMEEHISFNDESYNSILGISEVDNVYDYFEFGDYHKYTTTSTSADGVSNIKVLKDNNQEIYDFSYDKKFYNGYVIVPYYEEQEFFKQANVIENNDDSNFKVYVNQNMADLLSISLQDKDVEIEFEASVPVKVIETIAQVNNNDDDGVDDYEIDYDVAIKTIVNANVIGVLENHQAYTTSSSNVIYMEYNQMKELQQEFIYRFETEEEKIEGVVYEKWLPSSMIIYVKNYADVDSVKSKVSSIDPNIVTVSSYQDLESFVNLIDMIQQNAFMFISVVLLVIFILMTIIQMNEIVHRKYEIALLKANGFKKMHIFKLVMIESIYSIIIITITAFIISLLFQFILNILLFGDASLSFSVFNVIFHILVIAFLSIVLPTIVTLYRINKYNPNEILRN